MASFHRDLFPVDHLDVDEVVVRHGPTPVIDQLFPKPVADQCRPAPEDLCDPTRDPQYPPDFLRNSELARRKHKVFCDHAIRNIPLAAKGYFDASQSDRFGISVDQQKVRYFIRLLPDNILSNSGSVSSFLGIPLDFDHPEQDQPPAVRQRSAALTETLLWGAGIRTVAQPDTRRSNGVVDGCPATLGCFVRINPTGAVGLLTTATGLGDPQHINVGLLLARAGETDEATPSNPRTIATITKLLSPRPSSPRATLASGTMEFNQFDAVAAILEPEVPHKVGFGELFPNAPTFKSLATPLRPQDYLQTTVFKVGIGTGLTHGIISGFRAYVYIQKGGRGYVFENLLEIRSTEAGPFCAPGDGGALLVRSDGTALGLIIGHIPDVGSGLACLIEPLLAALDCELLFND